MSKQSEAKARQGYNPKPTSRICSNCVSYTSDEVKNTVFGGTYTIEKNKRCSVGGFAVKKTAVCENHKFKEAS